MKVRLKIRLAYNSYFLQENSMIQSLGLRYDIQETKAELVKQPDGEVATGLEEAVALEKLAPAEPVVVPVRRRNLGPGYDIQEPRAERVRQLDGRIAAGSEEAVVPASLAPAESVAQVLGSNLGPGYDIQEPRAELVTQPDGRVAAGLEEAVVPENLAPAEAGVAPIRRSSIGAEPDLQEAEAELVEQPGSTGAERSQGGELEHPAREGRDPQSGKSEGFQGDAPHVETEPAQQPASTLAEKLKAAVGFEHIIPEEVAVEPLSRIVFHTDPTGLGADRFRYLRLRLRELSNTRKLESILVTSPLPQDGKSTVALNLATALAERGENTVLLLEADLYHPVLVERLGLHAGPGLAECLTSGLDPIPMLRRIEPLGFYLLPGGKSSANPADLLHGDALANAMQVLSPYFKWIVIDSPPVAPLADALALARQADASLLIVRAGQTPCEAVDAAIESLGAKHVLGVVLNGVEGLARRYSKYKNYYRSSGTGDNHSGKTAR